MSFTKIRITQYQNDREITILRSVKGVTGRDKSRNNQKIQEEFLERR